MKTPLPLLAEKIGVRKAGRDLLHDVNLSLPPGSMTVLVGPNGSGKTTLIRVLAGIIQPSAGTVSLGNTSLRKMSRTEIARQCAYLPQQTTTNFAIRVEDAVALGRFCAHRHLGSAAACGFREDSLGPGSCRSDVS